MSRQNTLRVLVVGFTLMIVLLAAVAFLGARKSADIQANATSLIRDHVTAQRLVDQLEVEQQRFGGVLLRLSLYHSGREVDSDELLRDVESMNQEVVRLAGASTQDREAWSALSRASNEFAAGIRAALREQELTDLELDDLLARRDQFVHAMGQVIRADAVRAANLETAIATQSGALIGESGWMLAVCFTLALACAAWSVHVANDSLNRLERQRAELSKVSWHMLQGQESAARRFSHEMHDELGQSLTGIKTMLSMVTPGEFAERRQECTGMLEEAIRNVRELSQLLRPVILDDFGLDAALRWLTQRFQERTRITVDYTSELPGRLADETETHLFRITQESLTNVARHSGASQVRVTLKESKGAVALTIEDNGSGLKNGGRAADPGLGMIGMRERASHAGGNMRLGRSDLGGVRIEIEVPSRQPDHEPEPENAHSAG